jgi:hypothetical protein
MATNTDTKKIIEAALALDPANRAFVAETLLESLDLEPDFPVSTDWLEEIRRRCDEVQW